MFTSLGHATDNEKVRQVANLSLIGGGNGQDSILFYKSILYEEKYGAPLSPSPIGQGPGFEEKPLAIGYIGSAGGNAQIGDIGPRERIKTAIRWVFSRFNDPPGNL